MTRPILNLYKKSVWRAGAWISRRWLDQEGIDLEGARDRTAEAADNEEGKCVEEVEQEETKVGI